MGLFRMSSSWSELDHSSCKSSKKKKVKKSKKKKECGQCNFPLSQK